MIQIVALAVFFGYVPWALVCDFRTAKEVRLEWERIRKIRRGEDMDHIGESHLERKGKKNRWRSDRAWQECLFLTLQGLCWLGECRFSCDNERNSLTDISQCYLCWNSRRTTSMPTSRTSKCGRLGIGQISP